MEGCASRELRAALSSPMKMESFLLFLAQEDTPFRSNELFYPFRIFSIRLDKIRESRLRVLG